MLEDLKKCALEKISNPDNSRHRKELLSTLNRIEDDNDAKNDPHARLFRPFKKKVKKDSDGFSVPPPRVHKSRDRNSGLSHVFFI